MHGPAPSALFSTDFPVLFTVALIFSTIILAYIWTSSKNKLNSDSDKRVESPARVPNNSLFTITPFFHQRFNFLNWGFKKTGEPIFQFSLLQNQVIVLSGETAREAFFSTKGLDLTEGFKLLSGAIPVVRGVTSEYQTKRIALIHKRLTSVQTDDRLGFLIPAILEDSCRLMDSWGPSGTFDPFERIYELVFQTTVRSLSCPEIANDAAIVSRLRELYDTLDTGTTPTSVLLPWLPSLGMLKKLWASKEIYYIVIAAIKRRKECDIPKDDTLQMLLDSGDDKETIVGFIMGLLIAGARATGTTTCWLSIFLGTYQDWRQKAKREVEDLLFSYSSSASERLSSRLSSIPLEAWESSTPVLDAIIRETLRVAEPYSAMRKNLGSDVYIDGKLIPSGAYVVYPFSDVHLNPDLYPDPWKFDPGRNYESAEASTYGYVGWGQGIELGFSGTWSLFLVYRKDFLPRATSGQGRNEAHCFHVPDGLQSSGG
ncbi:hypothetical protein VKT23_001484 [Stygiomarasmius scandens]|uniref:Cytochrome P450 n=1 Tax=Marasmiellus scandens TaxID=2682957 RepID=A0ABR1K0L0_9AGAR